MDSASVAAPGGQQTVRSPTDKGKQGSKRHVVVHRNGIPLTVIHTAANVHNSKVLEEVVDAIEPIRKPSGRPRKRPNYHTYKPMVMAVASPRKSNCPAVKTCADLLFPTSQCETSLFDRMLTSSIAGAARPRTNPYAP